MMSPSAITPNRYLLSFTLIRFFNPFYLLGIYSLAAVYRLYHGSPRALCNFVIIAVINILPLVRARQCNSFYSLLPFFSQNITKKRQMGSARSA